MSLLPPPEDGAIMDDTTNTVTFADGTSRPYTEDEVKIKNTILGLIQQDDNGQTLKTPIPTAIQTLKQAKIDLRIGVRQVDNAVINGKPAPYIQNLAKTMLVILTELIRLEKLVGEELETPDLGEV